MERAVTHKMEKYTEIKPCVVEGTPDAHNVFLKVTNQTFCVSAYACDTKEDAEWMRDQLCVALEKIVADNCPRT
jgi:hypothetical protein